MRAALAANPKNREKVARWRLSLTVDRDHAEAVEAEDLVTFQERDPEPGDYVLVEYEGKGKKSHYVGFITQPKDD